MRLDGVATEALGKRSTLAALDDYPSEGSHVGLAVVRPERP